MQGNHKEAVRHFSEALKIRPDFADAHYSMGVALARGGETEKAVRHYGEALRVNPDFNLGVLLANKGDMDDAVKHFYEALRIRPGYAEAHNNLGTALARQKNLKEAVKHFSEAFRIRRAFRAAPGGLPNPPEMPGICQSQASIPGIPVYFIKRIEFNLTSPDFFNIIFTWKSMFFGLVFRVLR